MNEFDSYLPMSSFVGNVISPLMVTLGTSIDKTGSPKEFLDYVARWFYVVIFSLRISPKEIRYFWIEIYVNSALT